jgi:hypothetical protein
MVDLNFRNAIFPPIGFWLQGPNFTKAMENQINFYFAEMVCVCLYLLES